MADADDRMDSSARPSNAALAVVFEEIADLLELQGELVFKILAYRRAAAAISAAPFDVAERYLAGGRPGLPGVGDAIARKIVELAQTGRLGFLERLRTEVPPTLPALLDIPGIGPKTARLLWTTLGITSVDALRAAAEGGRLRGIRGLSARTEAQILAGIDRLAHLDRRLLLGDADRLAGDVAARLTAVPGVRQVMLAGSLRRARETIGDLDLLVETDDPAPAMSALAATPGATVLTRGDVRSSITLAAGPQVDVMAMPTGATGTYLVHFTGSREHNVRLRALARDQGWSLSEQGFVRLGEDGSPLVGPGAELRTMQDEREVYAFLGLPWIPPELREDSGEVEAAIDGRLPTLLESRDLRGDLHSHSDWSDGIDSVEAMAGAARAAGHAWQALTDHSVSLTVAHGLDAERFARQREVVAALNARYAAETAATAAAEGAAGPARRGAASGGFRLLHGVELEIRADGELDLPDTVLAGFDIVIASLHVARGQSRAVLTSRVLRAIEHPHVHVIAHPAGRMIGSRDDLDLDWDVVIAAAARTGTALELNGSPHRLDLAAPRARAAAAAGCIIALGSDAHRLDELPAHLRWATAQARRGWLEPAQVLNTRSLADLRAWTTGKAARLGLA